MKYFYFSITVCHQAFNLSSSPLLNIRFKKFMIRSVQCQFVLPCSVPHNPCKSSSPFLLTNIAVSSAYISVLQFSWSCCDRYFMEQEGYFNWVIVLLKLKNTSVLIMFDHMLYANDWVFLKSLELS